LQRARGRNVGFLGDHVNDAKSLHDPDAVIFVGTASEVAQHFADVVLLDKTRETLADGDLNGRRIIANAARSVLTGTSSNYTNTFQPLLAHHCSRLSCPMQPSQILLGTILYDVR
jgi:Mg2+-importing ATPase